LEEPSAIEYYFDLGKSIGRRSTKPHADKGNLMAGADVVLVLGGARSGKSAHAESLITAAPAPWVYVATASGVDAEMQARIDEHRARRGPGWETLEAPLDVAGALGGVAPSTPVLVDCMTLWLANLMHERRDIGVSTNDLLAALDARGGLTVLVSNEVGQGIVPDNALARRFRDEQGRLNQTLAARADRVTLVVAGLPLALKSEPAS
jgi:adenosylcobinamide kinase/adenosylcobinamide-phosphate guanylyltransferase